MTSNTKIPLKQAEVAVRRFNEQAIPHHLGLLKNHKSNIEKSLALGDWVKIKKEEINAMRVIKQLKNLLLEMDALREKVRDEDLERFDAMMETGKQKAFEAMKEYMELQLKTPKSTLNTRALADEQDQSEEQLSAQPVQISTTLAHSDTIPQIQTDFEAQQYQLAQRQACLEELEHLQDEICDLHVTFHNMRSLVQEQGESVRTVADNAEEALEQVQQGERNLQRALAYKKAMYPMMGALLGTCLGGPIGLVAGLKVGGVAAVSCGLLGYTGGTVLKATPAVMPPNADEDAAEQNTATPLQTLDNKAAALAAQE